MISIPHVVRSLASLAIAARSRDAPPPPQPGEACVKERDVGSQLQGAVGCAAFHILSGEAVRGASTYQPTQRGRGGNGGSCEPV